MKPKPHWLADEGTTAYKFPASHKWVVKDKPAYYCWEHAKKLAGLMKQLSGRDITLTKIDGAHACVACLKEFTDGIEKEGSGEGSIEGRRSGSTPPWHSSGNPWID